MPFKILYVTATRAEAEVLNEIRGINSVPGGFRFGNCEIVLLVAGIGSVSTAWSLKQWITLNGKPDLAINGGIAGSYNDKYKPGDVVMPVYESFADAGIEDGDNFLTLFESGLMGADEFPFKKGLLISDNEHVNALKQIISPVKAITVNTATGSERTRSRLLKKFNPDIETMEGATFFYICSLENIPFLALRAISNRVEPRNRNNWEITLALKNLSEKLFEVLLTLK
jgi:futalosine hydrolase